MSRTRTRRVPVEGRRSVVFPERGVSVLAQVPGPRCQSGYQTLCAGSSLAYSLVLESWSWGLSVGTGECNDTRVYGN